MSVVQWWVKKLNLSKAPWNTFLKPSLQLTDSQSLLSKVGVKEFVDSNVSLLKTWSLSLNMSIVSPHEEEPTFAQALILQSKLSNKENIPIKSPPSSCSLMDKIKELKPHLNKHSKDKKFKMFSQFIHLVLVPIMTKI